VLLAFIAAQKLHVVTTSRVLWASSTSVVYVLYFVNSYSSTAWNL